MSSKRMNMRKGGSRESIEDIIVDFGASSDDFADGDISLSVKPPRPGGAGPRRGEAGAGASAAATGKKGVFNGTVGTPMTNYRNRKGLDTPEPILNMTIQSPMQQIAIDADALGGANDNAFNVKAKKKKNSPNVSPTGVIEAHEYSEEGLSADDIERQLKEEELQRALEERAAGDEFLPGDMKVMAAVPLGAEKEMGLEPYKDHRPTRNVSFYTQFIVVVLMLVTQGVFAYGQVKKVMEDHLWYRLINLAWAPGACLFMLFALQFIVSQIVCAFGPIAHMKTNSKYFSAVASPRPLVYPKMTIQMPVYKESLDGVILLSINSLEAAIKHYRKAGGQASIFVNDDGLQLLSEKERTARIRAYNAHNIAYIARPIPSIRPRKGLFKKASNMNYALTISDQIQTLRGKGMTRDAATKEVQEKWNNEFLIGGDVAMGDLILLIDSDTRVPEDCLTKVVGEFELTPELGFLQCRTTPLRESFNYWENMIAHFTENIYDVGISLAVSAGDPAPLVGHNAFLRWEAMKAASWTDKEDGQRKYWSENHVSEDFDMSLRLQTLGYIGRYSTYTGAGFQEGVSLTAPDEVIRLRKYAFGSCEMVLNRFKDWPCKGMITKMYWGYLTTPAVKWPAKLQMTGYLGTYIAMAYAPYGLVAFVLIRAFLPAMQEGLVNPWDIQLTVFFVFAVIGMIGPGTIRYRMGYGNSRSVFGSCFNEISHIFTATTFFSSVLWPITTACWNYFWDIPMVWGATVKEATKTTFGTEVAATYVRYRGQFVAMLVLLGFWGTAMWYKGWSMHDYPVSVPLPFYAIFHLVGPFLLNPTLMRGYY